MTTTTASAPSTRRPGRSAQARHNLKWGLVFCSPAIVGIVLFTAYPVLRSLQQSLTSATMLTPGHFLGLQNYRDLMSDAGFWNSLSNTVYILIRAVPLGIIVALCLALLLNMNVAGRSFYRVFFFVPSIVPLVASAVIWSYVFNSQYGVLNSLLGKIGVVGPSWLDDPAWAKTSLVIMSVWGVGGLMVIMLAGVQDVPAQLYEQAKIDGAGVFSRFRNVTLPFMSPHLLFALVMGLIAGFQYFTEVFVLTSGTGGPAGSTMVAGLYLYQNAFAFFKIGYASALAWVLFVLSAISAVIVFRTVGRRVYYGGN
ncbi:multiple sugar transport system permease protein [Microlunatus panaciterrae]|uniref:Multiple sugar transport system permease protein n=1 Tax=Microlunatus panaciterrae TaxID=400768 RepID=A0ABS2RJL2_9ACTN|nr:sugar ABC transporter permease [Microlunatus panaciterrae]MBM7798908.1 multiple sugar transport system permease protein [Microlunatus panaciterrae]